MPTHGSLTKAGKVRNQTPRLAPRERKSLSPRVRNRLKYEKLMKDERRAFRR